MKNKIYKDSKLDLAKRQLAFLEDTVSFFNSSNRNFIRKKNFVTLNNEQCVYSPTENSPGCAIGRHLSKKLANELDRQKLTSVSYTVIFDKLPDWMKDLGNAFLEDVQRLHDWSAYWTKDGLSKEGKLEVSRIKNRHDLNIVKES